MMEEWQEEINLAQGSKMVSLLNPSMPVLWFRQVEECSIETFIYLSKDMEGTGIAANCSNSCIDHGDTYLFEIDSKRKDDNTKMNYEFIMFEL
ncbi:unnamed protein product [Urochloa humidicola]